jgi:uncharacterized protein (TIGR03435 family)
MVDAMRMGRLLIAAVFLSPVVFAQVAAKMPAFDVASVRPSRDTVGPDYNNQITVSSTGFTGKNVTLKRLIAEGWNIQLNQITGPGWIDHSEYDVSARAAEGTSKEQMAAMIRSLLAERFQLKDHTETKEMGVYELTTAKTGAKIRPISEGEPAKMGPGFHFHGDMRRFADLLAVQFSIPAPQDPNVPVRAGGPPPVVLDKTGLAGIYDFTVNTQPELNTDSFTVWQRVLGEQLGLKIDHTKAAVPVVVVDDALKMPTEN